MSNVAVPSGKPKNRFKLIAVTVLVAAFLVSGVLIAGPYFYSSLASHPQATCTAPNGQPGSFDAVSGTCVSFTVVITHQEQRFVDVKLLQEGFTASCWVFCNGITYTLDPTVIITNDGHDFEQCAIFKVAGTITCTATDTLDVIGLSESGTAPAATDHYATAGPCDSANLLIPPNGLGDTVGTVAAGAEGTTVTTTITHTFTAAETDNAVQVACLLTETNTGTNPVLYAEGTFGPDSLVSGNTLAITWSISRT